MNLVCLNICISFHVKTPKTLIFLKKEATLMPITERAIIYTYYSLAYD